MTNKINGFNDIVDELVRNLTNLGFQEKERRKVLFVAERAGFFVVLAGELHATGFNMGITHSWPAHPLDIFGLRTLMKLFGENKIPSLENQIEFLSKNISELHYNREKYEKKYRELNN